jgi:hypothetical protein
MGWGREKECLHISPYQDERPLCLQPVCLTNILLPGLSGGVLGTWKEGGTRCLCLPGSQGGGISWKRWRTPRNDRYGPGPSLLVLARAEEKVLRQVGRSGDVMSKEGCDSEELRERERA